MTVDISDEELHEVAVYLREFGRRLSRLLPAVKSVEAFGEDLGDVEISLNELLPLDIESALRPFCETPHVYVAFRWALQDLAGKLRAVADFNLGHQSPPGLYSFVRHATRVVGFALLRLDRVTDGTVSLEPRRRNRAPLRWRAPSFDDFLRTPRDVVEVIRSYRAVLDDHLSPLGYGEAAQECSPDPVPCLLQPLWLLPSPREAIEEALHAAIGITRDPRIRQNLEADLEALKNYMPSEAIPVNQLEHSEAWKRVHAL